MAVINGTPAGEPLSGTAGNDTITGAGGADTITMLGGSDLSLWNLGDGGDVVEGGAGIDTAVFTASRASFIRFSSLGLPPPVPRGYAARATPQCAIARFGSSSAARRNDLTASPSLNA